MVPTLTRPFRNNPESADWAQQMLCITVPNRRTAAPISFRVVVHEGYYLAVFVWFFHQGCACKENFGISYFALTRNGGTTDDLGRRFRCYHHDRSNLLLDHSVYDRSQGILNDIYDGVIDQERCKLEYVWCCKLKFIFLDKHLLNTLIYVSMF